MNNLDDIVTSIAQNGFRNSAEPDDYRDEDGFLCCGKCHTRKEAEIDFPSRPDGKLRVPHLCKCKSEERDREETEQKRRAFQADVERLRKDGITDPTYLTQTFEADDKRSAATSDGRND